MNETTDQNLTDHLGVIVFGSDQGMCSRFENTHRLVFMQMAEKNIAERLENLHQLYQQQRQTTITSELLDIVSGFEVLKGDG